MNYEMTAGATFCILVSNERSKYIMEGLISLDRLDFSLAVPVPLPRLLNEQVLFTLRFSVITDQRLHILAFRFDWFISELMIVVIGQSDPSLPKC